MFPYLNGLSREIASQDYECVVVTSRHQTEGIRWPENVSVNYAFGDLKIQKSKLRKLLSLFGGLYRLWLACLRQRPAYKNLHVFRLDGISVLICLVLRACFGRTALTVHDVTSLKGHKFESIFINRLSLRLPDAIVVHNEFVKQEIIKISGESQNIVVMPHGIDVPKKAKNQSDRADSGEIIFGLFGTLKKTKGILDAIDAFGILAQTSDNIRLRIVGKDLGTFEADIAERIARQGIVGRCYFENRFLSVNEFHSEILNSDVVLLPYHQIYQSGVAATAASLGKAIVASDLPGMRSTLGETAIYFETANAKSLAEAMAKLAQSAALRRELGGKARTRMSELFSWRSAAVSLIDGLNDLKRL